MLREGKFLIELREPPHCSGMKLPQHISRIFEPIKQCTAGLIN